MAKKKLSAVTGSHMKSIRSALLHEFGEVRPEWELTLDILANDIETYREVNDLLKSTGYYDKDTGRKNPLFGVLKDIHTGIMKSVQHLGLSPYAISKIRKESSEDDTTDFIESLTNE